MTREEKNKIMDMVSQYSGERDMVDMITVNNVDLILEKILEEQNHA